MRVHPAPRTQMPRNVDQLPARSTPPAACSATESSSAGSKPHRSSEGPENVRLPVSLPWPRLPPATTTPRYSGHPTRFTLLTKCNTMQGMWYCAYENWTRFRARVHCEGCGYSTPDRLRRVHGGNIGANDRWHHLGDFVTPEAAMDEARRRLRPHKAFSITANSQPCHRPT